jgi:hypothetical protein
MCFTLVGVSVELEGRADFLEEDFSGRLIKNSWRELDQRLTVEERFKVSCA